MQNMFYNISLKYNFTYKDRLGNYSSIKKLKCVWGIRNFILPTVKMFYTLIGIREISSKVIKCILTRLDTVNIAFQLS